METGRDPDDVLTLIFLAGHPLVDLKAVTLVPGTMEQVQLIDSILREFEVEIPIGVHNPHKGTTTKHWYFALFPTSTTQEMRSEVQDATDVLTELVDESTIVVTGGPLTNIARVLQPIDEGKTWVPAALYAQGGFAGVNVVPEKFSRSKKAP